MSEEIWSDEDVWEMEFSPTSPGTYDLIVRKMRLIAEVSKYLLPSVQRAQRRVQRTQRRIERLLEQAHRHST